MPRNMQGPRIMVIDDEAIVGKMVKANLEQDGFIVETFLSAQNALDRLAEQEFDVVITDLKMKGIDGMEVLRRVKSTCPETKVIMITAFASLDSAVEAMRGKADEFFAKPVKLKDLKACVQKLVSESAQS